MPKINWQGKEVDAIDTRFKSVHEEWNEYQLEDGSNIRVKCVVSEVFRIPEAYDQEKNPVYIIKSANMVNVKSPDHLKKSS